MTDARQALGKQGEDVACKELERRGYRVLSRRFRTRFGELDLVAQHREYVVFVEVKARRDRSCGDPAEAITPQKMQRLVWMATEYLIQQQVTNVPCRFDVVSVETAFDPPRVTVFEDAFRPGW
jgi:putative endonuclease